MNPDLIETLQQTLKRIVGQIDSLKERIIYEIEEDIQNIEEELKRKILTNNLPLNYIFVKEFCRIYFSDDSDDSDDKDVGNTLILISMLELAWTEKMSGVHPSLRSALKGRYDNVDSVENLNTRTIYKISSDETVEDFFARVHKSLIMENDEERLSNDPFAHKTND